MKSTWKKQSGEERVWFATVPARRAWASIFLVGASTLVMTRSAQAQALSASGLLGGYGAASSSPLAIMGGGRGPIIPYAGSFGGFMPYRAGGGAELSFSSRDTSMMNSRRTSFSLLPMSSTSGGMRQGLMSGSSSFGGMGVGVGGMSRQSSARESMRVMPPSLGYPFYQPPSLVEPGATGAGMPSM